MRWLCVTEVSVYSDVIIDVVLHRRIVCHWAKERETNSIRFS